MTQQLNSSSLNKIRIVLVNTSHPGNIGASARAMKNMGLSSLYLVQPEGHMSLEAISRSAGALDILDNAVVVDELSQAIAGCVWVAGTSARLRTVEWPVLEPRECVQLGGEYLHQGEIAFVFGRESSGLTNEELEKCNALLHIPANPEYSSLNLAAAVQLVCYELRLAFANKQEEKTKGKKHQEDALASSGQMEGMYQHLQETLDELGFFGSSNPEVLMRRLRGLFNRADATRREVAIIRGICSAVQNKSEK